MLVIFPIKDFLLAIAFSYMYYYQGTKGQSQNSGGQKNLKNKVGSLNLDDTSASFHNNEVA
jgi:hypothetical protein